MRRVVGHEQEEGRVTAGVLADEAHRVLGDQIRAVARLVDRLFVVEPVDLAIALVREVVEAPAEVADEAREAALQRVVFPARQAQMPLADEAALLVAGFGKHLRDESRLGIETVVVVPHHDAAHHPVPDRMPAGHQAGAGRRADRRHVEAIEPDALRGDAVDVGCGDIAAVEADVAPAEVVGDDEHDVGRPLRPRPLGLPGQRTAEQEDDRREHDPVFRPHHLSPFPPAFPCEDAPTLQECRIRFHKESQR